MAEQEPSFTLGIEEEYLLVDAETGALREAPDALMAACKAELADQVSPEFLRCQIEIGSPVAANVTEARAQLARLRESIARHSADFGLAPISVACHPLADWRRQDHTDKDRYNKLSQEMGGLSRRMLICGMHVHVGIAQKAQRIDLMNQFSWFLPHLLALSASSPFWLGEDTALASYRTTVFAGYPRTGLPPRMGSWDEYERSVGALTETGIIDDASKIWWDLRPSARFPTLETRICDACPRLDNTVTLVALIQATLRMLWRLSRQNLRWRQYDNFLLGENRWRATRYGITQGLIDFGSGRVIPFDQIAEDWLAIIAEDADALDSQPAVAGLRDMVARGSAAERQRALFAAAIAAGATPEEAFRSIVMWLIQEFRQGF
ncbi:carboxylate-amine ligase [Paracoccus thiocyanatus]|uniref:Putative glutamate--cysteine ligase 2 n=1 Tax=Paracoccus thiocyanatus TaxID=34006 RepID=A0A1N6X4Z5_9RHOB|nr:carboxylate-amine ligase [Paracoccus thiocyanatus]SIQ97359.1 carboxylate-amine ligase [Paracoccus thiocyanatus]